MFMKKDMITAVGIIPARFKSSRFPGKPLIDILGKPMIQRVYEQATKAKKLDRVIVATDDDRIFSAVESFGGEVILTSDKPNNGTERIAEIAATIDCSLVVNIQGDEPLIEPTIIDKLVILMLDDKQAVVGTLVKKISDINELKSPNIPKVILDKDFNAIYFSRSPIPYCRDNLNLDNWLMITDYYKHIGIYIYKRNFLLDLINLAPSKLEQAEQLEQLRILENGFKIKVILTEFDSIGVDVPQDVKKVEQYLKRRKV